MRGREKAVARGVMTSLLGEPYKRPAGVSDVYIQIGEYILCFRPDSARRALYVSDIGYHDVDVMLSVQRVTALCLTPDQLVVRPAMSTRDMCEVVSVCDAPGLGVVPERYTGFVPGMAMVLQDCADAFDIGKSQACRKRTAMAQKINAHRTRDDGAEIAFWFSMIEFVILSPWLGNFHETRMAFDLRPHDDGFVFTRRYMHVSVCGVVYNIPCSQDIWSIVGALCKPRYADFKNKMYFKLKDMAGPRTT